MHNDYTREVAPKFEIFDDRLEITSYGSLPQGLSEKEFFLGFTILRNKELMRIFKDLDLVEQLGSGIPRILEVYDKDCFKFSDNFLRVVLPSSEVGDEKSGLVDGLVDGLVESQQMILKLIAENPKISKREMATIIGISTTAIDKNIERLKDAKLIKRVGGSRSGYWSIAERK